MQQGATRNIIKDAINNKKRKKEITCNKKQQETQFKMQ